MNIETKNKIIENLSNVYNWGCLDCHRKTWLFDNGKVFLMCGDPIDDLEINRMDQCYLSTIKE